MNNLSKKTLFYLLFVCIIYYVYITYDKPKEDKNKSKKYKVINQKSNLDNNVDTNIKLQMTIITNGLEKNLKNTETFFDVNNTNEDHYIENTDNKAALSNLNKWNSYFNHLSENPGENIDLLESSKAEIIKITKDNYSDNLDNIIHNNEQLQVLMEKLNYNLLKNLNKLMYKSNKVNEKRQAYLNNVNEFPLKSL